VSLQERWAKLEPRERTLLLALMGVFAAILVLGVPIALYKTVAAMRDDNQEIRDVTDKVVEAREKLAKVRADNDARANRYARPAPNMATFLEDAARANEVELAETTNKADIPHGKKYLEKVTSSKMRKTGLRGLSKTLERIARSGYPVAITRLGIKPKVGEPDSYDVELNISAFERKSDPKKAKSDAADGAEGSEDAAASDNGPSDGEE